MAYSKRTMVLAGIGIALVASLSYVSFREDPISVDLADVTRGPLEITVNADVSGDLLMEVAATDPEGQDILLKATDRFRLSARGYHRVLKVARTIADLDGSELVRRVHIAEALSYRLVSGA